MLRRFVKFFASRPAVTVTLWLALVAFGVVSYTALSPREGFPSVDIPVSLSFGTYFVDDMDRVDAEVLVPLTEAVAQRPEVDAITTVARPNSFTLVADLNSGFTSTEGAAAIIEAANTITLPDTVDLSTQAINASKFLEKFDLLVGVFGDVQESPGDLETAAAELISYLEAQPDIALAEVVELTRTGVNPATGETVTQESTFNQLSTRGSSGLEMRPSIAVGIIAAEGVDSLGVRDATDAGLADAIEADVPAEFSAVVAIDQATQIRQQIGSLQSNVLTGIIAVGIVALLMISWRASIITAVFIFTVMATTFGALYLMGISINTISLFGVIIALGLFVDDAIVITEAIDAFRDGSGNALAIIDHAIKRVGAASVSGTITTVLVFAPMLAISGILGDFVRVLPISVITALIVSLVLSLVFIPFASRFLVLNAPESPGLLAKAEEKVAHFVGRLPGTRGNAGVAIAVAGIALSLLMTAVGLFVFAPRVGFNIFPPQKDSEFVAAEFSFEPGTSIEDAKAIALDVNQRAADALGDDLKFAYTWSGNESSAIVQYSLSPMGGRDSAPDIVAKVLQPIGDATDDARVVFSQLSAGPPEELFPFQLQLFGGDLDVLMDAAAEVQSEITSSPIDRPNGTTFNVLETEIGLTDTITRADGRRYIELRARFDADDVTTTTAQTQARVEEAFGADRLVALGLDADALGFDFGLESDNQESFGSMGIAFIVALGLMFVLLVVQFRSSIQWLLVFLAIPFSFFGVFGGLLITDNQISFFVMLGLLGLIGIAVNNTILLTDFANQERREGADRKQAIETAMRRRFRPLLATSLTTVAGVLPLALSDPFWESLGFTIIFGLLSSTFLVIVSFPYYYLLFEAIRDKVRTPWRQGPKPAAL